MGLALTAAATVRRRTAPNPWVGAVVVDADGAIAAVGATRPPGGPHAEVVTLARAATRAVGGTVVVTLEPCAHHGRTPPCTDALVEAGVRRVVVGVLDPDPAVAGRGVAALRAAGVEVEVGLGASQVTEQLRPYLAHRQRGRPWVVLKLAGTADGWLAAPDGSSQWVTGPRARADAHRLRADSDAIVVGAGTVRADDPRLTVRGRSAAGGSAAGREPLRVVLGHAAAGARVHPALELTGALPDVLDELGRRGVLQVLVEGGSQVAGAFHRAGLVDRYVLYLAPALMGGPAVPLLGGPGASTMADVWRGRMVAVRRLGSDLRIDLEPPAASPAGPADPRSERKAA